MQRPSGGRKLGSLEDMYLCDNILGKGFMDTGNWTLLRKKSVAEVKAEKLRITRCRSLHFIGFRTHGNDCH